MTSGQKQQMDLLRLPARLTAEQAATELGFAAHDIPVLVATKLLRPLGKPTRNSVKYFAAIEIQEKGRDKDWLGRATAAVQAYWRKRSR